MVGIATADVEPLIAELEHAGVFSRSDEGIIFSRRMVHDENIRELRASGGANSLKNPNVPRPRHRNKDTFEGSLSGSLPVSFGGSPSSSSSSSKTPSSELEACSDQAGVSIHKKPTSTPSREACKLASLLETEIHRNKPDYRITPAQIRKWEATADQILRLDGRRPEQVADVIRWVQRDEFWMTNVLSMETLRKKFDQLELKRSHPSANGRVSRTGMPAANVLLDNPATRALAQMEGD
jgi:hypothetical protein